MISFHNSKALALQTCRIASKPKKKPQLYPLVWISSKFQKVTTSFPLLNICISNFDPSLLIVTFFYEFPWERTYSNTVFPHIVSTETILFWLWSYLLWPLVTVHKCAETNHGRKLFKVGNYMRKYGMWILTGFLPIFDKKSVSLEK